MALQDLKVVPVILQCFSSIHFKAKAYSITHRTNQNEMPSFSSIWIISRVDLVYNKQSLNLLKLYLIILFHLIRSSREKNSKRKSGIVFESHSLLEQGPSLIIICFTFLLIFGLKILYLEFNTFIRKQSAF